MFWGILQNVRYNYVIIIYIFYRALEKIIYFTPTFSKLYTKVNFHPLFREIFHYILICGEGGYSMLPLDYFTFFAFFKADHVLDPALLHLDDY